MAGDGPPQKVVVYTNGDGDPTVYATAYTQDQLRHYLAKCTKRHEAASRPRTRRA